MISASWYSPREAKQRLALLRTAHDFLPSGHACRGGIARLAPLFVILLPLGGCSGGGILDPQGPIAAQELLLLINSTAIMLVVVIPVILATVAFAWWYRVVQHPRQSWHRRGV